MLPITRPRSCKIRSVNELSYVPLSCKIWSYIRSYVKKFCWEGSLKSVPGISAGEWSLLGRVDAIKTTISPSILASSTGSATS